MRLGFMEESAPALHRMAQDVETHTKVFSPALPRPWHWLLRMAQGVETRSKAMPY
jgi:hypothetical protein